jgi:hypothetical protein
MQIAGGTAPPPRGIPKPTTAAAAPDTGCVESGATEGDGAGDGPLDGVSDKSSAISESGMTVTCARDAGGRRVVDTGRTFGKWTASTNMLPGLISDATHQHNSPQQPNPKTGYRSQGSVTHIRIKQRMPKAKTKRTPMNNAIFMDMSYSLNNLSPQSHVVLHMYLAIAILKPSGQCVRFTQLHLYVQTYL